MRASSLMIGVLLLASPCAAQHGMQGAAQGDSSSAALFHCYEGAGCPAIGSAREAEAQQTAGNGAQRKPWYRSMIFWGTFAAGVGAAIYDEVETTRALNRCPPPHCTETFTTSPGKRRAIGVVSFALERGVVILLWNRAPEAADGVMFAGTALRIGYHITFARKNAQIKAVCPAAGAGCA